MSVFQMSFSSALLIITVIIIRALALNRLPKWTFLVLWGVVICRLFIPFSIPSRLSFFTGIDLLKRAFSETAGISDSARIASNAVFNTGYAVGTSASTVSVLPVKFIWMIGVCACALFFIVTYIKCRREFQTSLPAENSFVHLWPREHPMRRNVQIMQSDRIKSPLTYGIFHPVVLLPTTMDCTDETKLKYILTHEFVHIRRFDNLAKLLLALALCVHWFNPLVWVMYVLANRDIELSCDETVVQELGENIKSAYAMMLIGMEEKKSRLSPMCSSFSKNAIEERILSIMKTKKTTIFSIMTAIMIVAAGTTTAFAAPASAIDRTVKTANQYSTSTTKSKLQADLTINQTAISYDNYKNWLEKYKIMIQDMVQNGNFSQQNADKSIQEHEQILTNIQNGDQVSLRVDATKEEILVIPHSDFKISKNEDGTITVK